MKTQRESMPWLREREGQVWTAEDTARVEKTVAEVEATYQAMMATNAEAKSEAA